MKTQQARVNIEGFRAINKANIILDGITLVAGENGSGKSSIAKLLYYTYRGIYEYNKLLNDYISVEASLVRKVIDAIISESRNMKLPEIDILLKNFREPHFHFFYEESPTDDIDTVRRVQKDVQEATIPILIELYAIIKKHDKNNTINRLNNIMIDSLQEKNNIVRDDKELINQIGNKINRLFDKAIDIMEKRPNDLLKNKIHKVFRNNQQLPSILDIFEYESLIASLTNRDNVSTNYTIDSSIYIESQYNIFYYDHFIDFDDTKEHIVDLRQKLFHPPYKFKYNIQSDYGNIKKNIEENIIKGDIAVVDGRYKDEIYYKRTDGETFHINQIATGIKSFSVLLLLLKNNVLNNKTLLIIDEPESNLHPQWIVEYARIIVKLNKEIGVKFFIASHSPDMVMAIRYIAEKEGVLPHTNFYIAEKAAEKSFTYNYTHLQQDIEKIFTSFNIAIDRMKDYGL